jgi:hypothetical protein
LSYRAAVERLAATAMAQGDRNVAGGPEYAALSIALRQSLDYGPDASAAVVERERLVAEITAYGAKADEFTADLATDPQAVIPDPEA